MILFTLTPDKTGFPASQLNFNGYMENNERLNLQLDHFQDKFGFVGSFRGGNIRTEIMWPKNGTFMIDVEALHLTLSRIEFNADVITPFSGFKEMSLHIDHMLEDNILKSNLTGNLEDTDILFYVESLIGPLSFEFTTNWDIAGYSRYGIELTVRRQLERKTFRIAFGKPKDKSILNLDWDQKPKNTTLEFHVEGWQKDLPHVTAKYNSIFVFITAIVTCFS